jgi:hypothetical protein
MNREFKEWFIEERARALALVLLTRREDLVVKETGEENGLDFTVYIKTEDNLGNRPFGIHLAATMTPVTLDTANDQLKPVLEKVQSVGPFLFPVCVFYFTVKDDQGYYTWAYEPTVTAEGEPKLAAHSTAQCRRLGNESLEEILSAVKRWYDSSYATITFLGTLSKPSNS